jgi:aspartate/methionine/tyrosine aminotransferase
VRALDQTRHHVFAALSDPAVPCEVSLAPGAFYFFVRVHASMPPLTLAERLIREHGVAVMPGTAFGQTEGCSIRVSYGALAPETVDEGVRRLVQGLKALAV